MGLNEFFDRTKMATSPTSSPPLSPTFEQRFGSGTVCSRPSSPRPFEKLQLMSKGQAAILEEMDGLAGDTGKIASKINMAIDEMCKKYGEGTFQHTVSVVTPFETNGAIVTLCPWISWRSGIARTAAINGASNGRSKIVWFYGDCTPNDDQIRALKNLAEIFGIAIDYTPRK